MKMTKKAARKNFILGVSIKARNSEGKEVQLNRFLSWGSALFSAKIELGRKIKYFV